MKEESSWMSSMNYHQVVKGSNYEMGCQQGQMNAAKIVNWWNLICTDELSGNLRRVIWPIRLSSPFLRPSLTLYWKHYLRKYMPETLERIEGISQGAGCSVSEIFMQQFVEIIGAFPMHSSGCSSLWTSPQYFEQNVPVLAKNFDYLPFLRKFQIIRESYPEKGYACLELTETSMVGSHSGLNECGLTVIYHYAYAKDKIQHGLPMSMLVQYFLQTCSNVEEVLEKAARIPWIASGILMLGDAQGGCVIVELSHSHLAKSRIDGTWAAITNHFTNPETMQYAMSSQATFPRFLPPPWRGTRIRENSEMRLHDLESFFQKREKVALNDVKEVLADHGSSGKGENGTVCRHSKISSTICSIIFFPSSHRLLYCHGAPCAGKYDEFQLKNSR